jgi:RNA polymerase sigma factor (sigma-70 family)
MADRSVAALLRHLRQRVDPAAEGLSDGQLVGRFAARRDEAAFETLLRRHGPMVLRLCRSVLRDLHAAEDAFQATFLVLACKASAIRKRQSVASWLYGVALRVARRARARGEQRRRLEAPGVAEPAAPPAGDTDLQELRWLLAEELQRLPEKYRAPLVLCYLEGKTNQAAARELGWPSGSMSRRLERGRELLRERLTARGLAVSAALLGLCAEGPALAAVPASLCDATLRSVALFAAGATAPAAAPVALAQGVLRAMSAAKLKLLAPVLLVAALAAGAAGRLAYQARAAGRAEETPPVLPTDPRATVLLYDVRRADLPRQTEGPRLRVTADGTVSALDPYGSGRPAAAHLSSDELQGLLRFVLREHSFFGIDGGALTRQGRTGAATAVVQVRADGREHEVHCPDFARLGQDSPDADHLRAIGRRLERLAGWAYAGGKDGVAAALEHANRRLSQDFPKASPLAADDFQSAGPRSEGGTEVSFERRGVAPDGNPFSFVYARLEMPATKGEPRVTVKADLSAAAPPKADDRPPRGPFDLHPRPIAKDPSIKYDYDIVYVRAPRKSKNDRWAEVVVPHVMPPGGDLMLLHPDGSEELLVAGGEDGSIADPCVSFDGEWVYYAHFRGLKQASNDRPSPQGADVYKVHVRTRKVVRLTDQQFTPNTGAATWAKDLRRQEPGKVAFSYGVINSGPCPLPGGKVVFTSNRNGFIPPHHVDKTTQLFIMDDDGSNVEQIGHLNLGVALHPSVLTDGRVVFSTLENQGLRTDLLWGLWSIHPDGTRWGPVASAFMGGMAFHFATQLSNGNIVAGSYYHGGNAGFGTLYQLPLQAPAGYPAFGPGDRHDARNRIRGGGDTTSFAPAGIERLTRFASGQDHEAIPSVPGRKDSPAVGKVTHPSAAPDNHLLLAWSMGAGHAEIDSHICLLKSGRPVNEPGQMLLIKEDPNYHVQWPRALVPYQRIYGIDEPRRLTPLANDGKLSPHLPEGTPFGLVGTSSLYKRESYPDAVVPAGGVTAGFGGKDTKGYRGLDYFYAMPMETSINWRDQGADAGVYANSDIHAIRILVEEPTSDTGGRRFWSHARERLRILGEIPVRKFKGEPGASATGGQPLDPDGNPDTSFLAKIPADVAWTFQTLDKHGMVLNMAQTWHQIRPGEIRNDCGGCHAHSQKPTDFKLTAAAKPDCVPFDLTRQTPLLTSKARDESGKKWDADNATGLRFEKGIKNIEYFRDVKPILERSCAACHTRMADKPAAGLVLDDDAPSAGSDQRQGSLRAPGTYVRLAMDQGGGQSPARFGPRPIQLPGHSPGTWGPYNASRYVRKFQSRRSLLIWKVFGKRMDGWSNDDFPTERVPGDASTLQIAGKPVPDTPDNRRRADLDYSGSIMPPPEAVKSGKVKPLTDEDRLTLVRWIDLGCPIDLDCDPAHPEKRGYGWMCDDQRPTLTLTCPRDGANQALTRLVVGMHDAYSGLDLDTFAVTADFPLDGIAPGQDLAARFQRKTAGIWEWKLARPVTSLAKGKLTVSVKDRQGNLSRIERSFSVAAPEPARR